MIFTVLVDRWSKRSAMVVLLKFMRFERSVFSPCRSTVRYDCAWAGYRFHNLQEQLQVHIWWLLMNFKLRGKVRLVTSHKTYGSEIVQATELQKYWTSQQNCWRENFFHQNIWNVFPKAFSIKRVKRRLKISFPELFNLLEIVFENQCLVFTILVCVLLEKSDLICFDEKSSQAVLWAWHSETVRINDLSEHLWNLLKSDLNHHTHTLYMWM